MKTKNYTIILVLFVVGIICYSFTGNERPDAYKALYERRLASYSTAQALLLETIARNNFLTATGMAEVKAQIHRTRAALKALDFWTRYLEPVAYKKLNGPLPVEWETEVFEKFEKPYKREGAGLTLAALYLEEPNAEKDSLEALIRSSVTSTQVFAADSITGTLKTYHHFFLCNRLYLLNLAAIYSTGFECPDTAAIIPELREMMSSAGELYRAFNKSFPSTPLPAAYLDLYERTISFVRDQPTSYSSFDHFTFLKDYVNPLFGLNRQCILQYKVSSRSLVDYSLNRDATSIFSKALYNGQNSKGIFHRVDDSATLAEIDRVGKLLFYDPILSGNNERSCASCHKPTEYFTDTTATTSFQYNHHDFLARNSPSLINAGFNHLIMMDGKHYSLQAQTRAVISNSIEMGCGEAEMLQKVMSCKEYNKVFKDLLKLTPQEKEVTWEHIASAITYYYGKFSKGIATFDVAINGGAPIDPAVKRGFNLFMSKAQCGTCHFVPQFNGVKPPFVGSEFEVLGVPKDTNYKTLSDDRGRYEVNAAPQMLNAFRTGSIRNATHTGPYMHNGVFTTLRQVVDFYDAGGGVGHGLKVNNQTLAADSLHLSVNEKNDLIRFMESLDEDIRFESPPKSLPHSRINALNGRVVGGLY